jgi:SecD/SecF fusion protein
MGYVAFRFEPKFAVPVLIALFHDLLITAGVYSLSGREVTTSTVAALLTILGFSLYDTVIVFDRIRENAPRMPRATFSQIVNRSMSEVLTRSVATSQSTLFPVLALLLFGGETLKDFAFALLVGIASGTYSSIFIASPVLTAWKEREPVYVQRRHRVIETFGMVPAFAGATTAGVPSGPAAPAIKMSRASAGDGRTDTDDASPNGADLLPEHEPEPPIPEEEVIVDEGDAAEAEAVTLADDGERGDGIARPVARRTDRPARKKGSRAQRRRKGGRNK